MRSILWMIPLLLLAASHTASAYEEPPYTVLADVDGIEYRQYQPYLVAETLIVGETDRDKASSIGFRRLFRYISGDNVLADDASGPRFVNARKGNAEIAMTAPVRQQKRDDTWSVAFIVPSEFDADNVPRPTDPDVFIRTVPGALVAVLTYSGRWTDRNVSAHKTELLARIAESGVRAEGEVVAAFYNAPFTLPFMRRNEVMVNVSGIAARP